MAEHPKIQFTRKLCRECGLRYQIKGADDALFVYSITLGKFVQVCFSLLNLTEQQIADMIHDLAEGRGYSSVMTWW